MELNNYKLRIADLSILIKSRFEIIIRDETKNFIDNIEEIDITIELEQIQEPISMKGKIVYESSLIKVYKTDTGLQREISLLPNQEPFAWFIDIDGSNYKLLYLPGGEEEFKYSNRLIEAINIVKILNKNNAFLLHSSFIKYKERAILFSAPSGTGKSTQADLWKKYENIEIINGDRAGLRKIDNKWFAYGLPFAGSSNIYVNTGAPISHIILLRQGKENKLRKASPREIFLNLYRESIMQTWDEEFHVNIINMFEDLIKNVQIYVYECLPDKSAVDLLKAQIEIDNIENEKSCYLNGHL